MNSRPPFIVGKSDPQARTTGSPPLGVNSYYNSCCDVCAKNCEVLVRLSQFLAEPKSASYWFAFRSFWLCQKVRIASVLLAVFGYYVRSYRLPV